IIVNHYQCIRFLREQPLPRSRESGEQRLPRRVLCQPGVVGVSDGGCVRTADPGPVADIAAAMEKAGLRWIELNLSAPHGHEAAQGVIRQITDAELVHDYVQQVRKATSIPLAVKLTAQTADLLALAEQAVRG